jgi:hypothetical protein
MTALLDNAIAAISMGVEDYWRKEGHRAQSLAATATSPTGGRSNSSTQ